MEAAPSVNNSGDSGALAELLEKHHELFAWAVVQLDGAAALGYGVHGDDDEADAPFYSPDEFKAEVEAVTAHGVDGAEEAQRFLDAVTAHGGGGGAECVREFVALARGKPDAEEEADMRRVLAVVLGVGSVGAAADEVYT